MEWSVWILNDKWLRKSQYVFCIVYKVEQEKFTSQSENAFRVCEGWILPVLVWFVFGNISWKSAFRFYTFFTIQWLQISSFSTWIPYQSHRCLVKFQFHHQRSMLQHRRNRQWMMVSYTLKWPHCHEARTHRLHAFDRIVGQLLQLSNMKIQIIHRTKSIPMQWRGQYFKFSWVFILKCIRVYVCLNLKTLREAAVFCFCVFSNGIRSAVQNYKRHDGCNSN